MNSKLMYFLSFVRKTLFDMNKFVSRLTTIMENGDTIKAIASVYHIDLCWIFSSYQDFLIK